MAPYDYEGKFMKDPNFLLTKKKFVGKIIIFSWLTVATDVGNSWKNFLLIRNS